MTDAERLLAALRRAFAADWDEQRYHGFPWDPNMLRQHTFYFNAPEMRHARIWVTDMAGAIFQGERIDDSNQAWARMYDAVHVILQTSFVVRGHSMPSLSDPLHWYPIETAATPVDRNWRGWFEFKLLVPPDWNFEQTLTALVAALGRHGT